MSDAPFYKDHWINIEQERLDRYSTMFEWKPAFREALIYSRDRIGVFCAYRARREERDWLVANERRATLSRGA